MHKVLRNVFFVFVVVLKNFYTIFQKIHMVKIHMSYGVTIK